MKSKKCIKAITFILLFVVSFGFITRIVTVSSSNMEYQWMSGIYEEPDNSLDADGDIILLGRKGDVINVGGNKVLPKK